MVKYLQCTCEKNIVYKVLYQTVILAQFNCDERCVQFKILHVLSFEDGKNGRT